MTFLKPFPTTSEGRKFELRSKVIGVYDKGKAGSVVETQQDIVDKATGESYARAVGSAFFVGQGQWGGPKGGQNISLIHSPSSLIRLLGAWHVVPVLFPPKKELANWLKALLQRTSLPHKERNQMLL